MGEPAGFIKLHRRLLDNPIVCKDADHLAVWVWLLLKATWTESDVVYEGERITLKPGQLPPISRRTIASELLINESKVQRILKSFEIEHQIEQQMKRHSRLITIVSWDKYQVSEHLNGPQANHKRTTDEHLSEHNIRNNKNLINKESLSYADSEDEKSGWDGPWTYKDPATERIRFNMDKARKDRGL